MYLIDMPAVLQFPFSLSLFQHIIDDPSEPCKGEEHLAALTAADRTPWAKARRDYFSEGSNRASLDTVEKASFILCLDDEDHDYDPVSQNSTYKSFKNRHLFFVLFKSFLFYCILKL